MFNVKKTKRGYVLENKKLLKRWKYTKIDKWRDLWTKGNFRPGKGYSDWIHVDKTSLIGEYEVGAKRKINSKTISGKFVYFKSKPASRAKRKALAFARAYMRKY